MKKITYNLLAVIMVIIVTRSAAMARSEESRPVSGFDRITSGESLNVHVKIDGTESLKISTRADVIKFIETVVEDGVLKIKFKDNLKRGEGDTDGPIDIYVTAKSICSIVKNGSGSIDVDGALTGADVSIVLNGSGKILSAVKSKNLKITMSGAGSVCLSGNADIAVVTKIGAGEMNGRELKTKDASVVITGSGNVYISADKSIWAHLAGSGSLVYSGSATVTDSKTIGAGTVSKAY